jgi:arabinose-5-phosphate isomerase
LHYINDDFEKAVNQIHECKGRLVISGIGKSAIIAQKISATLNSTGTPSLYMHAADAIHGDLGMITTEDTVMIISKSGNSPEIKVLVPLIRNFGNLLIGMVGNMESFLARHSDLVLNTTVSQEACPNNLAPTSSTTAQMVMGDALAACLMKLKGFTGEDFAKFHPGGMLGKKLYLRVSDLVADNPIPQVLPEATLTETIVEMTGKRLGATAVVAENGALFGIITDGDLRRMLSRNADFSQIKARDIATRSPKTIEPESLAIDALHIMRTFDITHLVVIRDGQYLGILHLHDLVKEGLI